MTNSPLDPLIDREFGKERPTEREEDEAGETPKRPARDTLSAIACIIAAGVVTLAALDRLKREGDILIEIDDANSVLRYDVTDWAGIQKIGVYVNDNYIGYQAPRPDDKGRYPICVRTPNGGIPLDNRYSQLKTGQNSVRVRVLNAYDRAVEKQKTWQHQRRGKR